MAPEPAAAIASVFQLPSHREPPQTTVRERCERHERTYSVSQREHRERYGTFALRNARLTAALRTDTICITYRLPAGRDCHSQSEAHATASTAQQSVVGVTSARTNITDVVLRQKETADSAAAAAASKDTSVAGNAPSTTQPGECVCLFALLRDHSALLSGRSVGSASMFTANSSVC